MKAVAMIAAAGLASVGGWSITISGHRIVCGGQRSISCGDRSRQPGPPWAFAYEAAGEGAALAIRGLQSYEPSSQRLLATRDGGRHWRTVRMPCPRPLGAEGVALPTPTHGWLLCVGQPGVGQQEKAIYVTTDLGLHWRAVAEARMYPHINFGGLGGGGYPEGISFLAGGHGILWESRGTLFVTQDGGRDWLPKPRAVRPEIDSGLWAEMVPPRSALELLISDRGYRLISSSDFGRTWSTVRRWRLR